MFESRGLKALQKHSAAVLNGFQNSVEDDVGEASDKDATIMFAGWLHYSIALLMQSGRMKQGELTAALTAGALAVRAHAPNHGLGDFYVEVAQNRIFAAMREANGSPVWPFIYYEAAKDDLRVSEAVFAGALMRETNAVASMR
jgi:hypothetical protein